MSKKRILIFCDYYLPGYKSGGGMWTIVNMVERFAGRYSFFIVTRNHDGKNDLEPYREVATDAWNTVGRSQVFHASPKELNMRSFAGLVRQVRPDAVFLNSLFSKPARTFLEARRRRMFDNVPVIVAPCGEISSGSLSLKPLKKRLFLEYARRVGLFDGVIWKASFESEANDVRSQFGARAEAFVAPDLSPRTILPDFDAARKPAKSPGSARFVFVSRIVRKKNIHYFLELLREFENSEISFEVIGPVEDSRYWRECQATIRDLPKNISVTFTGPLHHPEVLARLEESHFFVLPTLHENFGYVFIEALAAGCPILISENTAWDDIEQRGVGWIARLDRKRQWIDRISGCLEMDQVHFEAMSKRSRRYSLDWLAKPELDAATAAVLERALNDKKQAAASDV